MKNALVIGTLLLVPGLVGAGVYWQRTRSLGAHRARALTLLGGRDASATLLTAADRFPDHAEPQFLAAQQPGYEAKFAKAEDYLRRAAAPGWPRAAVDRQHWLFLLHNDFRAAEPHLQRLRETDPDDVDVLVGLGLGYTKIGRLPMAEALAHRALQIDPDNGAALCLRGKVQFQLRHRDWALADLDRALMLGTGK